MVIFSFYGSYFSAYLYALGLFLFTLAISKKSPLSIFGRLTLCGSSPSWIRWTWSEPRDESSWKHNIFLSLFWIYVFPWPVCGFLSSPNTQLLLNVLISQSFPFQFLHRTLDFLLYVSIYNIFTRFLWICWFFQVSLVAPPDHLHLKLS